MRKLGKNLINLDKRLKTLGEGALVLVNLIYTTVIAIQTVQGTNKKIEVIVISLLFL